VRIACIRPVYIWAYITDCIFVFCIFYPAAFKRHYALRLSIAPEFFYCSYMCLFYVCVLWVAEIKYVCMYIQYYVGCAAPEHSSNCVLRHLPTRTAAPPRKQLSRTSAPARVSYRGHVSGEEANDEYRHRRWA